MTQKVSHYLWGWDWEYQKTKAWINTKNKKQKACINPEIQSNHEVNSKGNFFNHTS